MTHETATAVVVGLLAFVGSGLREVVLDALFGSPEVDDEWR